MAPLRYLSAVVLSAVFVSLPLMGCGESTQPLFPEITAHPATFSSPFQAPQGDPLTVMTRNLYHGGDIGPVLQVGSGDLKLLAETAAGVWAEVQANDFQERVVVVVDEIEAADPDVIGLQELARFVTLTLNPATGGVQVTGMIDFQTIMEDELAARGLDYSFVATQDNTQVQVPVAGVDAGGQFIPTELVQLTVRDGILLRGTMVPDAVFKGHYDHLVSLGSDPSGNPIQLLRGWMRVDIDLDGIPHHFVNTHLEIQSFPSVQAGQTEELLTEVVAGLDGVTIMTGDFNSDADGSSGSAAWTASYGEIRSAGFQDGWAMGNRGSRSHGPTCCQASDLRNSTSGLESRIDFVFIRVPGPAGRHGHIPGTLTVDRTGADPSLKTVPNGLWPSDHAGLVAKLWLAPGLSKPTPAQ